MSKLPFFLFLFCSVLLVEQSNAVKEYQDEISGHEGECKGKDNKFYKLGESMNDEACVKKICKGTAAPGSVYMEVQRCEKTEKKAGCQLKSEPNKNFPECCTKVTCKT